MADSGRGRGSPERDDSAPTWTELRAFARALYRGGVRTLTSSGLVAVFSVLAASGVLIPRAVSVAGVLICAVYAALQVWTGEHRRAERLSRESAEAETDEGFDVTDQEYWVLRLAAKYGIHFAHVAVQRHERATSVGAFVVRDTPIDPTDCPWLGDLVQGLTRRFAFKAQGNTFELQDPAWRAINSGRRRRRPAEPPGPLIDARSGAVVNLPL